MPNETQTYDTDNGQAQRRDVHELRLPPALLERFEALQKASQRLRKVRAQSEENKLLKRELTNRFVPELESLLAVTLQAFTETFELVAWVRAQHEALREHVAVRLGSTPLTAGQVSEEQLAETRRALANLGLQIEQANLDRDKLREHYAEVVACFNDLLDLDFGPEFDDEDEDDQDDGAPDDDADVEPDDGDEAE